MFRVDNGAVDLSGVHQNNVVGRELIGAALDRIAHIPGEEHQYFGKVVVMKGVFLFGPVGQMKDTEVIFQIAFFFISSFEGILWHVLFFLLFGQSR